jgi:phage terminase small subunit
MNPRWRAFIDSYFIHHMNATDAYCDVYGTDRIVGASNGQRLLGNAEIKKAINHRLDENAMSANEVLHGLADIARGDMADLMDITPSGFVLKLTLPDGSVNPKTKLIHKIKQKVTTYLEKSESDEDREVIETELELYSAHDGYKDMAKYHGLLIDRQELTVTKPIEFIEVERNVSHADTDTDETPEV